LQPRPPWKVRILRTIARRVPRGRYRLASAAPSHGRFVSSLAGDVGGAHFHGDMSDELSREVCLTGLYEPPVSRVIRAHLTTGGCMVDAGANWGYFSLLGAAAVGAAGRVMALEPDPRQFAALEANIELNRFGQITAMRTAAAGRAGRAVLQGYADAEPNRGVSRLLQSGGAAAAEGRAFEVDCIAIDELTSTRREVDVVKIDVEGAEDEVLEGMQAGLSARRYRAILLEVHPALLRAKSVEAEHVIRTLIDCGYRGWTIDMSPAAYRRAIDPRRPIDSLLLPIDSSRWTAWPHLLWRA
jgi:FkbM family methyltransferase